MKISDNAIIFYVVQWFRQLFLHHVSMGKPCQMCETVIVRDDDGKKSINFGYECGWF